MSAMSELHAELSEAGYFVEPEAEPTPADMVLVAPALPASYISSQTTHAGASSITPQKPGIPTSTQEAGVPGFFCYLPGSALMPTRRDIPHTEPAHGAVEAAERASVWIMWICVAYLAVRAFIPFLWHLFTHHGGR